MISITEKQLMTDIRNGLIAILPDCPVEQIVRGQVNRVPMPLGDSVVFTPFSLQRLRTNIETWDYNAPAARSQIDAEQGTKFALQIDLFGTRSADWAVTVAAALRSDFGCTVFELCQPLYADDGTQVPFVDDSAQFVERWAVTAQFQYNPVVSTPMQFADTLGPITLNQVESPQ